MYGMSRADSWGRAVTDTVEQTIAVDAHETDVLDPRTDAPAGKEPVTMAPVDLRADPRADAGGALPDGGRHELAVPRAV